MENYIKMHINVYHSTFYIYIYIDIFIFPNTGGKDLLFFLKG